MNTLLPSRSNLLAAWHSRRTSDLAGHVEHHGPLPLPDRSDSSWARRFARLLDEAGLLGRGGASFRSASKLEHLHSRGGAATLVVNAMEGEPASMKDRVLLELRSSPRPRRRAASGAGSGSAADRHMRVRRESRRCQFGLQRHQRAVADCSVPGFGGGRPRPRSVHIRRGVRPRLLAERGRGRPEIPPGQVRAASDRAASCVGTQRGDRRPHGAHRPPRTGLVQRQRLRRRFGNLSRHRVGKRRAPRRLRGALRKPDRLDRAAGHAERVSGCGPGRRLRRQLGRPGAPRDPVLTG